MQDSFDERRGQHDQARDVVQRVFAHWRDRGWTAALPFPGDTGR